MFLFSDPAPTDPFLLNSPLQKKSDSPLGDHAAGVLIGVTRKSAALADELGLRRPVVRVNVPAVGTFLRTELRWYLDHELPVPSGFVRKEEDEQAPAGRQDRPVETGLGTCPVPEEIAGRVFFGFRLFRHVFDFQILDHEEAPVRTGGYGMGGLVDHILPDVLGIFEGSGQASLCLLPVLRPFLLTGECSLPPSPAPLLLLHPALLDGGEIDPSPGARHHRRHHTPVESNGFAPEFLFRKHLKKQEEEKQNRPLDPLLPFGLRRGMPGQMFKRIWLIRRESFTRQSSLIRIVFGDLPKSIEYRPVYLLSLNA